MKKVLCMLLCLCVLIPFAVSCGDSTEEQKTEAAVTTIAAEEETTDDGKDENGFIKDDLPDDLNFGCTITTLHWSDYTMLEFYMDEVTGDNIESAIFRRNANVEERLGVTLEYEAVQGSDKYKTTYIQKAEADLNSGDARYDIYASYSKVPPIMSLQGYLTDLLSTKYFDIEKPWWPEALTDECTINNKLYFASGDISTNMLWMMTGNFYNRALYASYTGDERYSKTPEEYVADNEWTMELMFNMTKDSYIDTDGDNTKSEGDTFGMVIYNINIDSFQASAGIISIEKSADGTLSLSSDYNGQKAADVCQLVGNYLKSNGVLYKNSTSLRKIFFEERSTFIIDRCFIVAGKDNNGSDEKIEFSFGIVPVPKYSTDQESFCTSVGHPYTMYAISYASKNTDAASATLECLASESYRLVTPEVFESTMKVKYADGAEVAEMYDIIRNSISFDIGRLYSESFNDYTSSTFRIMAMSSPSSYLTSMKQYVKTINKGLESVMAAYD